MSSAPRPTASLTAIPLARTAPATPASKKDGDITARVAAAVPPALPPEPPPPPPPAPIQREAAPARPEDPPRPEEIVVYWERLRRGRPVPPLADLDRGLIANSWPDSMVVAFDDGDRAMPRISRLGATDGAIEYTPMVTDWILSRARHAARRAIKLDEAQSFPTEDGNPRYRLFLLPLGAGTGAGDCVLCHLCPAR
jgi:hypothetical protein